MIALLVRHLVLSLVMHRGLFCLGQIVISFKHQTQLTCTVAKPIPMWIREAASTFSLGGLEFPRRHWNERGARR